MKKILSILIVTVMLIGLIPVSAIPSFAAESYNLWVGETEVTSENLSGDGWSYAPSTGTLTLNNFNYEGVGHYDSNTNCSPIFYNGTDMLTLELNGKNNVKQTGGNVRIASGVFSGGKLTFTGGGTLNATGAGGLYNTGIFSEDDIVINGGTITARAEDVTVNDLNVYAIYSNRNVTINGGTVSGTACAAPDGWSAGVYAYYDLTVNGGSVTGVGGSAAYGSYGLFSHDGTVSINELSSEKPTNVVASGYSYALRSDYGVVKNSMEGKGWDNVEGTGDSTLISVNTEGTSYSFRRVEFKHTVVSYDLWVGDTEVTELCTSGTGWSYEPSTNTLTLDGFTYSGVGHSFEDFQFGYKENACAAISYFREDLPLNVTVIGENAVTQTGGDPEVAFGFYSLSAVNFSGGGKLDVTAGSATGNSIAVYTRGSFSADGVKINAHAGAGSVSEGICTYGNVNNIKDCELYAEGGEASSYSCGIYFGSGTLAFDGGKLTAHGGKSDSTEGLFFDNDATFKNCEVEAAGGEGSYSYGISSSGCYVAIENTVKAFCASGSNKAINNTTVKNAVAGTGWGNVEGTGDGTFIPVNTEGTSYDYRKVVFPHVHSFTAQTVDDKYLAAAATCTAPASYYKSCSICGEAGTETFTSGEALGHDLGDWETVKEPNCTEKGSKIKKCSRCDYTEPGEIDELGHSWVENADEQYLASAATCTEPAEYYKSCERCKIADTNNTFTDGDPLGHDLGDWETVTEPTCTEKGSKIKRCSRCTYTEPGEIPKLGHSFTAEVPEDRYLKTSATCDGSAVYYKSCIRCELSSNNDNEVFSYGDPNGHALGDWETVHEPTCTEKGLKIRRCANCSYVENGDIDPLGHDFNAETVDGKYLETPADCENAAVYRKSCTRCGEPSDKDTDLFVAGEPLGHDMGEWETTQEPNCTEKGAKIRKCSRCRYAEDGEIDPLGHDYEAVVTDPTCTEDGFTTYTCSRCGDVYTDDPVKALGHDYEAVVTPPGCETEGFTTMKCRRCNDAYKDNDTIVAALGHEWDEGKETKPATESAEGEKTFTCKLCGQTKVEKIAKLEPKKEEPRKETPAPSKQTGDDITTLLFIATLALTSGAALTVFKKKVFDNK